MTQEKADRAAFCKQLIAAIVTCLIVLQTGCAARASRTEPADTVERPLQRPVKQPIETATEESGKTDSEAQSDQPPPKRNPVTESLREQARTALNDSKLPQATRLLERALRIDPRDPATYYLFALLRQQQEQPDAAQQLVDKALSLRPDQALKQQLVQLRSDLGDTP